MYSDYILNKPINLCGVDSEDDSYKNNYDRFCAAFVKSALAELHNDNNLCSPANIYLLLSMLRELTAGDSVKQIVNLIGDDQSDIARIRKNAELLYASCCGKSDEYESLISDSAWLSDNFDCKEQAVSELGQYGAEIYRGNIADKDFSEALKQWINDKTGNLLKESTDNLEFARNTAMMLVCTMFLSCAWFEPFDESLTKKDVFFGSTHSSTVPFMHWSGGANVFYDSGFTCATKGLSNGGNMWFVLPNEEHSTDEVLKNPNVFKVITDPNGWDNSEFAKVEMAVPKFDITCGGELISILRNFGICDIFDCGKADFSPLSSSENLYISQAEQACRLTVDERGIKAASYSVMGIMRTALLRGETVKFELDRPFVFAITNRDNAIMIAGVINDL